MSQRVFSTTLKHTQVVVGASPAVTIALPRLDNLKIRRMSVEISGWRVDGADDDTPYINSLFMGSRAVLATRGANSGTPTSYAASSGEVVILPTRVVAQPADSFGACDIYDDEGFGLTPEGNSPLVVTYVAGAGGTGGANTAGNDSLSFVFNAETADQNLAMTVLVSYEDQDIVLT
jgi:hypothetical protein